jgi:MFS family permease
MIKLNAKFFLGGFILTTLFSGLFLGFLMDYFNGWKFGASFLVIELTDHQNYALLAFVTLVASLSVLPFFRKKEQKDAPDIVIILFRLCITLTAVLIMGVVSYCTLPASLRNTVFGWGMADFLSAYPTEADILKKTLIEKKPDPAEALPNANATPLYLIGPSWQSQINIRRVAYATHCSALIIHGFVHGRNNQTVAVFLDGVDEDHTKKVLAEDIWIFYPRPLFSTRTRGLILEWQDITYQ